MADLSAWNDSDDDEPRRKKPHVDESVLEREVFGEDASDDDDKDEADDDAPAWQDEDAAALKKKRTFRKFTFRGVDLDALLDLTSEQLMELVHARARRRFSRGLKKKGMSLVKKLRKAKKDCGPYDKPDTVKTHLRNMIIVPEMIGSVVGVHNGKVFTSVEVKADMVGHYLGEFSISYKPVRHGRPGIGATSSSKFIPLK